MLHSLNESGQERWRVKATTSAIWITFLPLPGAASGARLFTQAAGPARHPVSEPESGGRRARGDEILLDGIPGWNVKTWELLFCSSLELHEERKEKRLYGTAPRVSPNENTGVGCFGQKFQWRNAQNTFPSIELVEQYHTTDKWIRRYNRYEDLLLGMPVDHLRIICTFIKTSQNQFIQ